MRRILLLITLLVVAAGCSKPSATDATAKYAGEETAAQAESMTESQRANEFFEETFIAGVMRNPLTQDFLGIKQDQDKWPDLSDEFAQEGYEITQRELARLRSDFDYAKLDAATQMSYTLFERNAEQRIASYEFRYHSFPVTQMSGAQSNTPAHLINIHRITSVKDAENYIARLNGFEAYFAQVITNLKKREALGIVAPKFVFPYVIADSHGVLEGMPFDASEKPSALYADFTGKVDKLDIPAEQRTELVARAKEAMLGSVAPAYQNLIGYIKGLQERAGTDDGVWRLPNGAKFYQHALKRTTTTDMSPDQIHDLGLAEVARIHAEMRTIMTKVGFEDSLQEFFAYMRTDKQFYFDETDAGRQAYLDGATGLINTMRGKLDEMFLTKPKADIVVKRVEPFREVSAGKAFYGRPAPDGSRPGTYYANLYRMSNMPSYQMEALAYHEGIPGHHMQIAIALELDGIPKFRKWGRYTAYSEGWGLYSEYLPKEFGFYQDPYSDFGRLAMELWRACRLVVDSGIHHKRWTREEAIDYLATNTPNPHGDVVKAIERYIVMPSQATAYKVGMLKILELRARAQAQLGEQFDIREFHDAVLRNGPVPLAVLDGLIDDYISAAGEQP